MRNFSKISLLFALILITGKSIAQIGINATGAAPDAKSMLDISSTSKGFLWPRMTIAQRNAISSASGVTPEGLTVFDTDTKNLWIYKNAGWKPYLASPWDVNGNDIFNMNTGSVMIGTSTPGLPNKLYVVASGMDAIRAFSDAGCTVCATNDGGSAVAGNATGAGYGGFFTSTAGYALITGTGNVGIGTNGPTQKLDINGQVRIRGGSPASGKVLTSTADGTSSWESLPAGSNVWAVNGTNIYSTNLGGVGIGTNLLVGNTKLHLLGSGETFMRIESEAADQLAGIAYKNPEHQWALGMNIGNYSDGRFNLNHSVPNVVSSTTSLLTISETGNVGIGSFIATLPSERLEIKDGYLKVSGATKTAFIITAGSGGSTINGNRVRFSYPGMSTTDILIVNHQYVGAYIGAVGNWYDTGVSQWSIFREDLAAMPIGEKFTVLVIKQ